MNKRSYEMGYTPREFEKTLLGQFSTNTSYQISASASNQWSVENKDTESASILIEINISIGAPRKIALLTLPVLNTDFTFKQASDEQEKEFLKIFFKYFHKGGG